MSDSDEDYIKKLAETLTICTTMRASMQRTRESIRKSLERYRQLHRQRRRHAIAQLSMESSLRSDETTMRVLVVDDMPTQRFLLASLVSHCNCTVSTASGGAAALELAAQFKPDVVLLDLCMPEMNGYELAMRLRNAGLNKAKLVAISSWESDCVRVASAHIDQYLHKPVTLHNVKQLLTQPLCSSSPQQLAKPSQPRCMPAATIRSAKLSKRWYSS